MLIINHMLSLDIEVTIYCASKSYIYSMIISIFLSKSYQIFEHCDDFDLEYVEKKKRAARRRTGDKNFRVTARFLSAASLSDALSKINIFLPKEDVHIHHVFYTTLFLQRKPCLMEFFKYSEMKSYISVLVQKKMLVVTRRD